MRNKIITRPPPGFEPLTVPYVASPHRLRCSDPHVVLFSVEELNVGDVENPAVIGLYCSFQVQYQSVMWVKICYGSRDKCTQTQQHARWYLMSQVYFFLLYAFFWVIPRRLYFICRRFETLCSIFIGGYMKIERTECSETSAYNIQTPGNYPEESIQHS